MNRPEKSQSGDSLRSVLDFDDNRLLPALFGDHDRNLAKIEQALQVEIAPRGHLVSITGPDRERAIAQAVLIQMYENLKAGADVTHGDISGLIRMFESDFDREGAIETFGGKSDSIRTAKRDIAPRSPNQNGYVQLMRDKEMVFALGPAGTGKTYLSVAMAVSMMLSGQVDRIILSRPAVEAGERLGFLPGDMREKIDPYLRPLYDALYDMMPGDQVARRLANGEIEIAPLAFMRGRTLANAFVILDEAQNTSPMQMKMFLTRLGEHSRMVVTGDPSQVDLPQGERSGLDEALHILRNVKGIGRMTFTAADVVRHPLVTRIVRAYDDYDSHRKNAGHVRNPEGKEKSADGND